MNLTNLSQVTQLNSMNIFILYSAGYSTQTVLMGTW